MHSGRRVVVVEIPSHPMGMPVEFEGRSWMRRGESLVPMTRERRREIYSEAGYDFSADICQDLTIDGLSKDAIADFRRRWMARSGNDQIGGLSLEQLLADIEVVSDAGVT